MDLCEISACGFFVCVCVIVGLAGSLTNSMFTYVYVVLLCRVGSTYSHILLEKHNGRHETAFPHVHVCFINIYTYTYEHPWWLGSVNERTLYKYTHTFINASDYYVKRNGMNVSRTMRLYMHAV